MVEMSLSGLTTQEIAQRIYHTPEAVENYLKLFDRVLLLRYTRYRSRPTPGHRPQQEAPGGAPGFSQEAFPRRGGPGKLPREARYYVEKEWLGNLAVI
ncbi:MAG: DUF1670 domain-containing protein [Moorellaceae bacterium]